jgi:prolyl 3-hydroxylase /prolyl 3,4-dihydroxylase
MAPHEGEEDPAVYRSGSSKQKDVEEESEDRENEEDEDDTLLTVQPAFNRLLLTLRDARVLHFVKYISAAAYGSRWDIRGEWEVGMVAETDDEQEHDEDMQ